MIETGKNIVNRLANEISLTDKTTEELTAITKKYPYFGFTHLLLAKNLKNDNGNAEKKLQQCALYFSNPFWLHYLLNEEEAATENNIQQTEADDEKNKKNNTIEEIPVIAEAVVKDAENNNISPADIDAAQPEIKTEKNNFEAVESVTTSVEEVVKKHQENILQEAGTDEQPAQIESEANDDAQNEKLSKLIEQHLSEFKKPVEGNEELPITPKVYHAIDYFASQGIKLDPRLITEDMLGKKVKKFTDWLKQMKRANDNPTDLGTDEDTEHLIEKIAQTSNETKDVITETMAQVLIKQGKTEKAIQLYQKLSFLNPSKTTYFAAKINELKGLK